MRAKNWMLLVATAALLFGVATAASAAEKQGKPLYSKSSMADSRADDWRERAMKARAEFEPAGEPRGNARALDERGDRSDGEEVGAGALGRDRGEGGKGE